MDIVRETVKLETMLTNDVAKGEDVKDEEEGAKPWASGDTLLTKDEVRCVDVDANEELSV